MKPLFILLLIFISFQDSSQKTLMVEKIGTLRKYYFHIGEPIKIRVSKPDTLLRGKLWGLADSMISVSGLRPFDVGLKDVHSVFKQFPFPRKAGKTLLIGSAAFFGIIVVNHLLNNEPVFTPDLFIITGAIMGSGLISLSLSQKRCRIGSTWKLKVLNISVY
jgi:hypothetical protein